MERTNNYRRPMGAEYVKKHYPDGYFAAMAAANNSGGSRFALWFAFIMLGVCFNIGFILAWFAYSANGVTTAFFVLIAVGLVQLALCSLMLRAGKKLSGKTAEDWIAEAAASGGCSESDARAFDRQVKSGNAYFLTLSGKPQKDYVLTDDFLAWGTKAFVVVFPFAKLAGAGLTYEDDLAYRGKRWRTVGVPGIGLISAKGKSLRISSDDARGRAFFAMLREKNPDIMIRDGERLSREAFAAWAKELSGDG